jgi:hypothetical protein
MYKTYYFSNIKLATLRDCVGDLLALPSSSTFSTGPRLASVVSDTSSCTVRTLGWEQLRMSQAAIDSDWRNVRPALPSHHTLNHVCANLMSMTVAWISRHLKEPMIRSHFPKFVA